MDDKANKYSRVLYSTTISLPQADLIGTDWENSEDAKKLRQAWLRN